MLQGSILLVHSWVEQTTVECSVLISEIDQSQGFCVFSLHRPLSQ